MVRVCGGRDGRDQTSRSGTIEQRVVDAALAIAAEVGWEQVRLSTIADRTELPLAEIGRHFRDVDAIANAWFARARLAMLALPAEELAGRPADERIALAFGAWLDSLAPHRRVAAEILRHKLYPPIRTIGCRWSSTCRGSCTICWTWRGCRVPAGCGRPRRSA